MANDDGTDEGPGGKGREPFLRRHARPLLGAAVGAAGGALYAGTVGCSTGSCPLTSNVWVAALYFGFVGAVALLPSAPREERGSNS